ncbi:MAG TPA: GTP cyclohydrolase FolE2 [Dokdonella sp.]|uniref:GTP cyclohydrolase FolE2 n=1 Tax=Dokdonella sp. TaxID=2291710 RepID=UPI002D7E4BD5|nr:GTP cyclohydrolase FolE2 [Dokdonella sp.]HET9031473.1 GTP cyclohydrolase FolE2 [Dokdonella sp.]
MNALTAMQLLPDVQAQKDFRQQRIDAVGVKGVRYPIIIHSGARAVPTIANFSMTVALAPELKGTHMSRFIELIEARAGNLDQAGFRDMVFDMLDRLDASSGRITMRFPYFVSKAAPVSGVSSLLDHDVEWSGSVDEAGHYAFHMQVKVPATSLCPCSKQISAYGAHNQRSHISIAADICGAMSMEELIGIAEASASCEVYGLLKRADEKFVTERAYDNPKFVEDLVRDVAHSLDQDPRIEGYVIEAENFESIHNHSAFARIERPKPATLTTAPTGRARPALSGVSS